MSFVSVLEHYPAAMPTRLSAGETNKSPRQMTGGDAKFSELLKNAATDKTATEALSGDDRLGLLQEDLRRHMVMNMFNYMDLKAITLGSHERWQSLDNFPVTRESSNNRQASILSDAASCPDNIDEIIHRAARHFEVEPSLIRSVIKVESNYNAGATSSKGAMGLMQLMPGTAADLGVNRPYDPEENIMGGTRYLKLLLNRYQGDIKRTLAAYNWGMGNVDKNTDRMPQETKSYIDRVLRYYEGTNA